MNLWDDFHVAPEGDMILDRFGRFLRFRIVPGGILIRPVADPDVVVAHHTHPGTGSVGIAWSKKSS